MAEDYYGGEDSTTANESPESSSESPDSGSSDKMGAETSLLPKSMFPGKDLEPGHKCVIEIVADRGDELEVRYSKDKAEATEPDSDDTDHMAAFDKEMGG